MHKFLSDNTVPSIRKIDGVFTKLMMQVVMIILTKIMFLRQISDKKKEKKRETNIHCNGNGTRHFF